MKRKISLVLTVTSALLAVGGTVLRTRMLRTAYSAADGFYLDDFWHGVLYGVLLAFVISAFAAAHIYIKEGKIQLSRKKTLPQTVASLAVAVVLSGFILFTAAKFLMFGRYGAPIADIFICLFALAALPYYLGYEAVGKKNEIRSVFCICAACALLAMVFGLYFHPSISYVNHSVKLAFAAAIFTMLATAAEANGAIGRTADRRYFSYAPVAVALTFTAAIPDIVYYLTEKYAILTNVFYDLILLVLGIYHFVRLLVLVRQPQED